MPSNHLILCHPLFLLPSIISSIRVFFFFFKWVSSSHQVAKVLEFNLKHLSFQWTPRTDLLQDGLVGSPCSPRDSQESSPTPQFKSINSSTLSFLHSPTLTSIYDHWKNHSLDWTDLCWTGRPAVLLFMGLQRVRHNWTELKNYGKCTLILI